MKAACNASSALYHQRPYMPMLKALKSYATAYQHNTSAPNPCLPRSTKTQPENVPKYAGQSYWDSDPQDTPYSFPLESSRPSFSVTTHVTIGRIDAVGNGHIESRNLGRVYYRGVVTPVRLLATGHEPLSATINYSERCF